MQPRRRYLLGGLAAAGLLAVGLLLAPRDPVAAVRGVLYSPWFPVVLVGLYAVRPLLAWPITALSIVVGYRYGLALGLPVALAGAVGTSLLPYAVGRYYRDRAGPLARAVDGSERYFDATGGLRGVVAARLAPTPAEPVSLAAGAGRVSLGAFALGTAVGELPWTVAAVLVGRSLTGLSADAASPSPWLVAVGLLGAALLLAGPAYRTWRSWRGAAG